MANIIKLDSDKLYSDMASIVTQDMYNECAKIHNAMLEMQSCWEGDAEKKFEIIMSEYINEFKKIIGTIDIYKTIAVRYANLYLEIENAYINKKVDLK